MTKAKIIILRTTVFNCLVIRRVPDIFLKNSIFMPTKDALNSIRHVIFLNYWVKKAI